MKKNSARLFAILVAATLISCAHRVGSQVPVSNYEKALVSNAILASVNKSVTDGVIATNKAGLLSTEKTKAVLDETYRISQADEEITAILEKGPEAATLEADKIRDLLGQINQSLTALGTNGSLAIKNPLSQQTFLAQVNAVMVIAEQEVRQLQDAGILK